MELFLNALWLLIALGVICLWRCRWCAADRDRPRRQQFVREAIALGCALFLLFPVISLTDDLHAELALAEDASGAKRALQGWCVQHAPANSGKLTHHAASSILPPLPMRSDARCWRLVELEIPSSTIAPRHGLAARAPPLFSL